VPKGFWSTFAVACWLFAVAAAAAGLDDLRAGNDAFRQGDFEQAVEAYTRAIIAGDLEPEALAVTYNNRGVAYNELGDFDHAIADYQEALGLVPGDATTIRNLRIAYVRRAVASANLGHYEEALADLDKAIELDRAHPLAYLRRAEVWIELGDFDAARRDLESAERLRPSASEIERVRARLARLEKAAEQERLAETPAAGEDAAPARPRSTATATATAAARGATPPESGQAPVVTAKTQPSATEGAVPATPKTPPSGTAEAPPAARDQAPPPVTAKARPPAASPPSSPPPAVVEKTAAAPAAEAAGTWMRAVADVNARAGPGNDRRVLRVARRGTRLLVLGEKLGWKRVRFKDGLEAFIYKRWLEPVAPAAAE